MSELVIKLNDIQASDMMSAAILSQIDAPARERMMQEAIKWLITPKRDVYSSKEDSPLASAFRLALAELARKLCAEIIQEPQNMEQIRSIVSESIEHMLGNPNSRGELMIHLSSAMLEALTRTRS